MRLKKYIIVFTVIMTVFGAMIEITYGAPKLKEKRDWNIPFLGTLQVPAQLEIVDGKDVIREIITFDEKVKKSNPSKGIAIVS